MENSNHTQYKEGRLIYISGGGRSGKSAYAQNLAQESGVQKVYLATCPTIDEEMDQRIAAHKNERAGHNWLTVEEPLDLVRALRQIENCDVVLIDCLTLWLNNLLYQAEQDGRELTENDVSSECCKVIAACRESGRTIIVVSNEVGMGLVPADALSRCYRDLIGRCNQHFAKEADEALFMVSGIPLKLK